MTVESAQQERLHGLDAVRGYALLLGVVFHATLSFLPGPAIWPVSDPHRSILLGVVFYISHIFRMSTFFLIAGFFGHMVVQKRGVAAFVTDRAWRILLPFVVGWPLLLAAIVVAFWVALGHLPAPLPRPPGAVLPVPLTHLWFLYLLLWFYAAAVAARVSVERLGNAGARLMASADALVRGIMKYPAALLFLALPAALALNAYQPWFAWAGIPPPDQSLVPPLPSAIQYGLAFGFGWLLHRQAGLIEVLAGRWLSYTIVAVILSAGLVALIGTTPVTPGVAKFGHALLYVLAIWTATFAVIAMALRFLSNPSPVRRYVADSSYWIYLIHVPIVIVLQGLVRDLDWPAELKIVAILAVALPLMLASYQFLVRGTVIGAVLNGRRIPAAAPRAPMPVTDHAAV